MSGFAAVCLADGNREGMKLVEEPSLLFRGVGGEGLADESGHGLISLAIVAGRGREKPVARTDAAHVLVGDGNGMAEGVKQNGVRGFRANAGWKSRRAG
jgi:hypothetical protein